MSVIDVHTHMLGRRWFELLRQHGGPHYAIRPSMDVAEAVYCDGAPFLTPQPAHFDYALRVRDMSAAKVDVAIVSLTAPSCYWGGREVSLEAAALVNGEMATAQKEYPDRIRWFATLPWEHPDLAVEELARACDNGAVGVMVMANINGHSLTEPHFAPIWSAIDARALPVLLHPTSPPGTAELDIADYGLVAAVGFMVDTTLAISRMILDGFFDRFPNLKLIASHAGATLPFIAGRLDFCWQKMKAARQHTSRPPSEYLRHIYYDAVCYRPEALALAIEVGGADHVMYGSDYPHNIGDMVGCLARVDALPAVQREAIRGGNAKRVFKL
jgi:aminocarboxymuconate-semialdehyde decarboxylase